MNEILTNFRVYLESLDGMQQIFIICMGVALILPLLNIIIGSITLVLDIDFDLDTDGTPVSEFFPISPMCVLTFMLIFGGLGLLLYEYTIPQVALTIAILCGYVSAIILNKLVILPMKRAESDVVSITSLIGEEAKVTTTIEPTRLGEIELSTKHGQVSYIAKSDTRIEIGTRVKVISIHKENDTDIMEVKIIEDMED